MTADLAQQLQSSLAGTYTIVRELGGGGMSRVFLADDLALGRPVVIKVLLPELAAGVNADRFKREVQLSARLQHPHIVPVLTAGEVDGLPYYVMPYVKGDSLRAHLSASGPMSVGETVSILGDVAKALAYAQSDGVVHRDIKPDNILLSGGAATVADFGIAKAISSARETPGETLTSLGTSLGTPAYMAPEQVAGDPNVDHRADIYSLGCVAYEMLTGHSPFAGKSPQQMLAAQIMETPAPIAAQRKDVPAALISLIDRCLAKEPAARPQSASDVVAALEASSTLENAATATRRAPSRVPTWALVAGLVVLGVTAVPAYRYIRSTATPTGVLTVAVAPFEVLDPQLGLWKEGMVDVLSRNLDGSGPIRTVPPAASIKKWGGHADRTVATTFGQKLGAQVVVYGQIQSAGPGLVNATAWVLDTKGNAQPIEVQLRDSASRMDRVTDSLSVKVLGAIGRDHPIGAARLASLGSGSLPAIKAFLQGSQYFRRTQWDSAAAAFRNAVAIDSTFGIAYLHLSQALGWSTSAADSESIEASRRAGMLVRPGLSPHDSLLLTAAGHYARAGQNGTRNKAEANLAIAAMQAAVERYPSDPEAWYLLGDMRYHADPTITDREALAYFDHAIAADSDFAPAYIHAIELANRYGANVGRRYSDAYLRRDPTDVEAEGIKLAARAADPQANPSAVNALIDTLPPRVVQKAYGAMARLPDSTQAALKLLQRALHRAPDAGVKHGMTLVIANQLSLHGHVKEAWPLAVETHNRLASELPALGLIPPDSAMKVLRPMQTRGDPFFLPLPTLALLHDTATLAAQLARFDGALPRVTDPRTRGIIGYLVASLRGYLALARNDTAEATRVFDSLPDSIVEIPIDQFIRARLIEKQDPKRALGILSRHMAAPDVLYPASELESGRLAERLGDTPRAVDAYSYVAAVWQSADPGPLREAAKEAAAALKRLDADGRVRAQLTAAAKP